MAIATGSPVGVGSAVARRRLTRELLDQAQKMVYAFHDAMVYNARRGKLYFVLPAPGDKAAEALMRGLGAEMMGNRARIGARLRHTRRAGKTQADVRHTFRRLEVGILNLDGQMPLTEHLMTLIKTSRSLRSLEGLPAGIGSAVTTAASIGLPVLKLLTRDSARAKVMSFVGNLVIGSLISALDAPLGTVAFFVNGSRLENGLDMGDQVADVGGLLGYARLFDHPEVPQGRKRRLAEAFLAEYAAVPRRRYRSYAVARTVRGPLHQAARAAGTVSSASRALESVADIPGVGEAGAVASIVRSMAATGEHPPFSMRERVEEVLRTAAQHQADAQAAIEEHPHRFNHEARQAIAAWTFRREVATLLHDLALRAEEAVAAGGAGG
jgi:hypothetical protein